MLAGYVRLSDFATAIYLTGVDPVMFNTKIDDAVKNYWDYDELPNPAELMTSFLTCQDNKLISKDPAHTAFATVTHKKSSPTSCFPPGPGTPCSTCLHYSCTNIAKRHILSNCKLNPQFNNYHPDELDRAENKAKYLALKAGRTSPTSVTTPSPGRSTAAVATYTKAKTTRKTAYAATTDPAPAFNAFFATLTHTALPAVKGYDRTGGVYLV